METPRLKNMHFSRARNGGAIFMVRNERGRFPRAYKMVTSVVTNKSPAGFGVIAWRPGVSRVSLKRKPVFEPIS